MVLGKQGIKYGQNSAKPITAPNLQGLILCYHKFRQFEFRGFSMTLVASFAYSCRTLKTGMQEIGTSYNPPPEKSRKAFMARMLAKATT